MNRSYSNPNASTALQGASSSWCTSEFNYFRVFSFAKSRGRGPSIPAHPGSVYTCWTSSPASSHLPSSVFLVRGLPEATMFSPRMSRASLALASILSLLLATPASTFAPAGIVHLSAPRSHSILAGVRGGARKVMPLRRQGQRYGTEVSGGPERIYIRRRGYLVCTPWCVDQRWNRGSWAAWTSRLLLIDAGFVRI